MGGGSFSEMNFLEKSTTSSPDRPDMLQVRSSSSPLGDMSFLPLMCCGIPISDGALI